MEGRVERREIRRERRGRPPLRRDCAPFGERVGERIFLALERIRVARARIATVALEADLPGACPRLVPTVPLDSRAACARSLRDRR